MHPPAAMQAAALVCRHSSSSSLRVVLPPARAIEYRMRAHGRWQVPTNGPCRANSGYCAMSRPPKLYRQNLAENCQLIREYIRYFFDVPYLGCLIESCFCAVSYPGCLILLSPAVVHRSCCHVFLGIHFCQQTETSGQLSCNFPVFFLVLM